MSKVERSPSAWSTHALDVGTLKKLWISSTMASMDATFETILLVVGIFALAVVGHVSYTLEIRNAIHQRFLNSIFQSHVNRATTLASTTKLQNRHVLFQTDQADFPTVCSQPWVHFSGQNFNDLLLNRPIKSDGWLLGLWRLNGQLSAKLVSHIIDHRFIQVRKAWLIQICGKAITGNTL